VKRLDNTYMFFHLSFREWLLRRDEGENIKFLCDLRAGHAGIAFRLSRVQAPLDAERTLELGHHILKAHIYRNMSLHRTPPRDLQAHWVTLSSSDPSSALCALRNIYNPNVKVIALSLHLFICSNVEIWESNIDFDSFPLGLEATFIGRSFA